MYPPYLEWDKDLEEQRVGGGEEFNKHHISPKLKLRGWAAGVASPPFKVLRRHPSRYKSKCTSNGQCL